MTITSNTSTINVISSVLQDRQQISLNGTWTFIPSGQSATTITVPEMWNWAPGFTTDQATYQRNITIPSNWTNRTIKVEFDGINFVADVYIGNTFVINHVGGFVPFTADITNLVTPGNTYTLKVIVKSERLEPFVASDSNLNTQCPNIPSQIGLWYPLWPEGYTCCTAQRGIVFDVYLRAYGKVHILDTFIKPSYRNHNLVINYTLKNSDTILSHTFSINSNITSYQSPRSTIVEKSTVSDLITLTPNQQAEFSITIPWTNPDPTYWFPYSYPDNTIPHLYMLYSSLIESIISNNIISNNIIDYCSNRFGFREIWIQNGQFMINGIRINLYGTSMTNHVERNYFYDYMTPANWPTRADNILSINIRHVRFHTQPVNPHVIDTCDEKGLLVISESAIYASGSCHHKFAPTSGSDATHAAANKATYLSNCLLWIPQWIKAQRNHPSIIFWSAENEMGSGWLQWLTANQMRQFGTTIRQYDSTRPVGYDGEGNNNHANTSGYQLIEDLKNIHYRFFACASNCGCVYPTIASYPSIYSTTDDYAHLPIKDSIAPTGFGEELGAWQTSTDINCNRANAFEERRWLHGTWARGLRYNNFTDVRPYRLDWAWTNTGTTTQKTNLINSYNPVALFDKDYDGLGIAPLMNPSTNLPSLDEGSYYTRTLVLYNDEFKNTSIDVTVTIKSGANIYATGSITKTVTLGEHITFTYRFQTPYIGGSNMDIILSTKKNNITKFSESKTFKVTDVGQSGTSSNTVTFP